MVSIIIIFNKTWKIGANWKVVGAINYIHWQENATRVEGHFQKWHVNIKTTISHYFSNKKQTKKVKFDMKDYKKNQNSDLHYKCGDKKWVNTLIVLYEIILTLYFCENVSLDCLAVGVIIWKFWERHQRQSINHIHCSVITSNWGTNQGQLEIQRSWLYFPILINNFLC